ncbi:MAG: DUF808 domain-containing protein [Hyphomonadaceae bacterium]|nr:DUF808 domain-containing protein [Hyphomonadaceae bacterium]
MSTGLLALLDDVAALAKVAAASLDDAAAQATKAGGKAAGIVIDDAAVTPRYVVGFASDRELPIIGKIAMGSLKNKMLFLLPGALVLSWLAPWIITPLLMIGGAYLCLEGFHKVAELITPHAHDAHGDTEAELMTPQAFEDSKVDSAIRTDFILSAEIMAISLATVASSPLWLQAIALAVVGVGMTALVYGAVAIIVRADDWGAALALTPNGATQAMGRAIVKGMPGFLTALSHVGMVAMLWVGGGILLHGAHGLGWHAPEELQHAIAHAVGGAVPLIGGAVEWLVNAAIAAILGLGVGALVAVAEKRLLEPTLARFQAARAKA